MSPTRWARITEMFESALEKAPDERPRFLDEACGADKSLRSEVERLLAQPQDSWLKSPVGTVAVPELSAGQVLGRYQVEAKLGQGGMGAVYQAHDSVLRRTVALKILPASRFADAESRQRLVREARAASALNHPNIVTIHDIDRAGGIDFIAMEYVAGKALNEVIPRKGLPLDEALKYAVQIADALAAAHAAGIVHRDIKPSNILVSDEGRVKVLDFGLAKLTKPAPDASGLSAPTAEGFIQGTAAYMSPEQAQGKPVDARSDIFSFGAVLYEMIRGSRAFSGDTPVSTIAAILTQEPPPPGPQVPRDLGTLMARCLRKDPPQRFQHMDDVRVALDELRETPERGTASRGRRRRLLAGGFLLLLAIAAAAGLIRGRLRAPAGPPAIRSIAVLPLANLSGDPGQEYFADGMTDALITALARMDAWRVISRTSVMRYKETKRSLPEIAQDLSVDAVVEGTVLRSGARVRIAAQLIEAATDQHLWSGSFEQDLGDILLLQGGIARAIAAELKVARTPGQQHRVSRTQRVDPEAYEEYLKGWYFFNKNQWPQAASHFEKAAVKDPGFALAHALLYEAESMAPFQKDLPLSTKAVRALEKARALDNSLAEVHTGLGDLKFYGDWDWAAGEAEFRRAVELDPASVDAALHYATCLRALMRWDAAIQEYRRALRLDPVSLILNVNLLSLFVDAHRDKQAIQQFQKTIELDPNSRGAYRAIALLYEGMGREAEALAAFLKADALSGRRAAEIQALEGAARARGIRGYWRVRLEQLRQAGRRARIPPLDLAYIYTRLRENDQALKLLEAAYQQRLPRLAWLKAAAMWDPLRSDPRFQSLLRRMKFPD